MARLILAFLFIFCLAVQQVSSQASFSGTNSISNSPSTLLSGTGSGTGSGSGSASGSSSGSGSGSGSGTGSGSVSSSGSGSASVSVSTSVSVSGSNSVTPPAAPVNVANTCTNAITSICPSWENPTGVTYALFNVSIVQTGCATCTATVIQTSSLSGRITNLLPETSYDVYVIGILASGLASVSSTVATFTTNPADPKVDPTLNINTIVCNSAIDATTERSVIKCTWNAAAETLTRLVIKWRCASPIAKNSSNKKRLYGAAAQATSVTLNVNRGVATCAVFFRAYYARRPAARIALTVIMGN